MTNILEILHQLESHVGRDLTQEEDNRITEYIEDDPMSVDPVYLAELFEL